MYIMLSFYVSLSWLATIGYCGQSSGGRPLRSYCLLWIPHSSHGAALHVATNAPGSPPDSQTTFALLLLIKGEDTLQSRLSLAKDLTLHVCTITSLSISHSSYQVTLFFLCKASTTQRTCCFDLASMMSYHISLWSCVLQTFRLITIGACTVLVWSGLQ